MLPKCFLNHLWFSYYWAITDYMAEKERKGGSIKIKLTYQKWTKGNFFFLSELEMCVSLWDCPTECHTQFANMPESIIYDRSQRIFSLGKVLLPRNINHFPVSSLTRALILKKRMVEAQTGTKYWNTENFQLFSVLVIITSSTNSTMPVQIWDGLNETQSQS